MQHFQFELHEFSFNRLERPTLLGLICTCTGVAGHCGERIWAFMSWKKDYAYCCYHCYCHLIMNIFVLSNIMHLVILVKFLLWNTGSYVSANVYWHAFVSFIKIYNCTRLAEEDMKVGKLPYIKYYSNTWARVGLPEERFILKYNTYCVRLFTLQLLVFVFFKCDSIFSRAKYIVFRYILVMLVINLQFNFRQ